MKIIKTRIRAGELLVRVREQCPIIHHLTNWVTVYDCASITKTLGASPVMAHAVQEAGSMAGIADALVLNIGTLTVDFVKAMKAAAKSANSKGIPVVLDVCGAGATGLRDRKSLELLRGVRIDVLKG
nr:hydroxyethylthiazole kinase [Candidatus Omnitrophota bacterium]